MQDVTGSLTIIFNGEIYNHAEVRKELEARGYGRWQTDHSDTEVILNAFHAWGIDCLQTLRGMFAFALWDERSRKMWLVRDRIGIKPLYFAYHDGRLLFASEIKALLRAGVPKAVDERSLFYYLTLLIPPAPQTLFKGVSKLPAGSWLCVTNDGTTEMRRYWDVWDHVTPLTKESDSEIAERLLDELRTAVRYRKVSDRPVGVFLSGGIDSSTNATLFAENEPQPVQTFTIGYHGDTPSYRNENEYARRVAARIGAKHHELMLTPEDVSAFLPRMAWFQDEPIGDPVCVPLYFVSRLARHNGTVVCQVGEGADELFHGYRSWAALRRLQRWAGVTPGSLLWLGARAAAAIRAAPPNRIEYLDRAARGEMIFVSGATGFPEREARSLMSPDTIRKVGDLRSEDAVSDAHARFKEAAWEKSVANWMTYADLRHRLPELLLMRVDKMSMAVALEARVPFLDHKFVALAMSIPTAVKLRGGVSKAILKQSVRGLIPDEIIDRPKQGFGMPLREWLHPILPNGGRVAVERFCDESGLLSRDKALWVLEHGDPTLAWLVLNLGLWWGAFWHEAPGSLSRDLP
jgi:asparagine synthase (glutamine-hydrolysing)